LLVHSDELKKSLKQLEGIADEAAKVAHLVQYSKPLGGRLRAAADRAEQEVADEFWELPKYREMLFHHTMK